MDENLKKLLLQYLKRLKKYSVFLGITVIVGMVLGYFASHFIERKYQTYQVLTMQDQETFNSLLKNVVAPLNNQQSNKSVKSMLKSNHLLLPVAKKLELLKEGATENQTKSVLRMLRENLIIEKENNDEQRIKISFTGNDPVLCKRVVEEISNQFIVETQKFREKTAQLAAKFLSNQLVHLERQIDSLKAAESIYKKENFYSLPHFLQDGGKNISAIQKELIETNSELKETEKRIELIQESLRKHNPQKIEIETELSKTNREIQRLNGYLKPAHPKMKRLMMRAKQLEKALVASEVPEEFESVNGTQIMVGSEGLEIAPGTGDLFLVSRKIQEQNLLLEKEKLSAKKMEYEKIFGQIKGNIEKIPQIGKQLEKFKAEILSVRKSWNELNEKLSDANHSIEMARLNTNQDFTILTPAELPLWPVSPKPSQFILIGGVIGLLLFAGTLFLLEWLRGRILDAEDVRSILEIPCPGSYPCVTEGEV